MHDCGTCRFEEFFLSSWAVGDPAMIVDVPANAINPATGQIRPGPKATKALYPDDPSNVYHSYMGDHVKFRILHAGTNITHVHHLHAHQWLHTPNERHEQLPRQPDDQPGRLRTRSRSRLFGGSGNRNQTVGDSIFHCHFYPHFAQGMWSLWRVHDVFEAGTALDYRSGRCPDWNRALPDGEISTGTPIPAVVPLPTLPMAPIPAKVQLDGGRRARRCSGRAGFREPGRPWPIPIIANGARLPVLHPGRRRPARAASADGFRRRRRRAAQRRS